MLLVSNSVITISSQHELNSFYSIEIWSRFFRSSECEKCGFQELFDVRAHASPSLRRFHSVCRNSWKDCLSPIEN